VSPARGTLRDVCAALRVAHAARRPIALAVVHATEGSTYRKAGALIALDPDGTQHGTLSGGCLEPELRRAAARALAERSAVALDLDTRGDNDDLLGSGSGCRGRMQVLVLPLDGADDDHFVDALASLEHGESDALLALVVDGPAAGAVVLRAGARLARRAPVAWGTLLADLAAHGPQCLRIAHGDAIGLVRVLCLRPPRRLLVFGAGPEAPPLARFARELGWRVEIADHRPALLDAARLAADRLHLGRGASVLAALAGARLDAAVVMTHGLEADLQALQALARHAVPHVALLGPPARRDALLARLDAATCAALGTRLQAPAGLALGGEGPEAIALSIVAGLPLRE
jgi:xanthine dehydrogenase accessory factor